MTIPWQGSRFCDGVSGLMLLDVIRRRRFMVGLVHCNRSWGWGRFHVVVGNRGRGRFNVSLVDGQRGRGRFHVLVVLLHRNLDIPHSRDRPAQVRQRRGRRFMVGLVNDGGRGRRRLEVGDNWFRVVALHHRRWPKVVGAGAGSDPGRNCAYQSIDFFTAIQICHNLSFEFCTIPFHP